MRFELARRDPDDTGPCTFTNARVLPASPERLFEVLTDEAPWPAFFPGLRRSRWLTAAPHGVGSLRRVDLDDLTVLEHIVAWRPAERFTFYLERASLPIVGHLVEDYLIEAAPGGSRLVWHVHYRPRRWRAPLHPVVRPMFARRFATAIDRLGRWLAGPGEDRGRAADRG